MTRREHRSHRAALRCFTEVLVVACLFAAIVVPVSAATAQPRTQRPGTIQGIVEYTCPTDAAGTLVFIPGRSFIVITGSDGSFALSSVPPGTYTVRIEAPGRGLQKDVPDVVVTGDVTTDLQTVTLGDLQSDANNCGTCGNVCSSGQTCASGVCTTGVTCNPGFGDCDSDPANGCETDLLVSTASCGACGNVCSFPNASAACMSGSCALSACDAGFSDCDGNPLNGCETVGAC